MRVMADTNIHISALLFPASLPAKVLSHIVDKHELVLCDHIVAKIRDVVARKRPDLLAKEIRKETIEALSKIFKFPGNPVYQLLRGNAESIRKPHDHR